MMRDADKALHRTDLDVDRFSKWLVAEFGAGETIIQRISGGQSNPTYFIDHGGRRMVLRKKPSGPILPGAHAIEREFKVLTALSGAGFPVPQPFRLEERTHVLGTPFYLMERLEGRVFANAALGDVSTPQRRGIYLAMAETLARLHAIEPAEIGLADFGKSGNYFSRQFARWCRQYAESPSERVPPLERLARWLGDNIPADDARTTIAHGDFRIGNLMYHPERPEVVGVLDWELATLGHPLADLGFCCIPWVTSPDEFGGILGLDLAQAGIPPEADFVQQYYRFAAPTPPLRPFHVAFALFRFAVIFVGIADRSRAGNAADAEATRLAPLAARFAQRGLDVIDAGGSSPP